MSTSADFLTQVSGEPFVCMIDGCGAPLKRSELFFVCECSGCGRQWRKETVYYWGWRRDVTQDEFEKSWQRD